MLDTSIQVKTSQFDGPLSLLLLLIQKEQMNIRDFDLETVTKQYLDFLDSLQELDFDVAGDYLYLAATLIYLKSKDCLNEEDQKALQDFSGESENLSIFSQSDLIRRLEELQRFQKLGQKLWSLPQKGRDVFVRPKLSKKYHLTTFLKKVELDELTLSMVDFLIREKRKYKVIKRDRLSIKEKLLYLKQTLLAGTSTTLKELIEGQTDNSITNLVINFISLLELARLKKLEIFQNEDKGDIYLKVKKSLTDLDIESANGFEPEEPEEPEEVEEEVNSEAHISSTEETLVSTPDQSHDNIPAVTENLEETINTTIEADINDTPPTDLPQ